MYFMYSHLPYFLYIALLLRRRGVHWWRLLLDVWSPWSSACGKMVYFLLLSPFWTCNKTRCNKHWLCCLFHYLLLYVWNLILEHIKECIQFGLKTGCDTYLGVGDKKRWEKGIFGRCFPLYGQREREREGVVLVLHVSDSRPTACWSSGN
jgi:hypothetical protein